MDVLNGKSRRKENRSFCIFDCDSSRVINCIIDRKIYIVLLWVRSISSFYLTIKKNPRDEIEF